MVKVDPKLYLKCMTRRESPCCMWSFTSLHIRYALLFYHKLKKELEEYGFIMNPYNLCVANYKTNSGCQLNVLWKVDDLKLSCRIRWETTKLLLHLKRIYGDEIVVHYGKKFEYLRMDHDYSEQGIFTVSIIPYIDQIHHGFPVAITKSNPCPHNENLFHVHDESETQNLPKEKANIFHYTVVQLVFQTTTSF